MRKNYCTDCENFDGENYCNYHDEYIRNIEDCDDFEEDCGYDYDDMMGDWEPGDSDYDDGYSYSDD